MLSALPYLSESGHSQGNPQFEVVGRNRTVTLELDSDKGVYWCYDILMESHPDSRTEELVGKILGLLHMPLESAGEKFLSPEWYKKLLEALRDRNIMGEITKLYRKTFPGGHNSYSMIVHSHLHHGSAKNHNPWIYHGFQNAFISAGEKNRYHHPSQKVLDDIENTGAQVHLITENSDVYVKEYVIV